MTDEACSLSNGDDHGLLPKLCSQCGTLAVGWIDAIPLCVNCFYKFEVARTLQLRAAVMGMNYAAAEMDHMMGMPSSPRMQVPDIPKGPPIFNNINVSNSVVGAINTGSVHLIDVSIGQLDATGAKQIGDALKRLTEVILKEAYLETAEKDRLLEQLAYLSEQAVVARKDRRPGMIGLALESVSKAASAIDALTIAWNDVGPLLNQFFGIG